MLVLLILCLWHSWGFESATSPKRKEACSSDTSKKTKANRIKSPSLVFMAERMMNVTLLFRAQGQGFQIKWFCCNELWNKMNLLLGWKQKHRDCKAHTSPEPSWAPHIDDVASWSATTATCHSRESALQRATQLPPPENIFHMQRRKCVIIPKLWEDNSCVFPLISISSPPLLLYMQLNTSLNRATVPQLESQSCSSWLRPHLRMSIMVTWMGKRR